MSEFGPANRFKARRISPIIAASLRRFSHRFNADEVFGTHRAIGEAEAGPTVLDLLIAFVKRTAIRCSARRETGDFKREEPRTRRGAGLFSGIGGANARERGPVALTDSISGDRDNRVTLSATQPQSLTGALDKEVFEDKAIFAPVERSAATAAGYLAIHCLRSSLGSNDPINRTAIWAIKACRNFSHESMRHNGGDVSLL